MTELEKALSGEQFSRRDSEVLALSLHHLVARKY